MSHATQKTNPATQIEETCKPDRKRFVEGHVGHEHDHVIE